jgi:pyruvate dehydrogenase E2 component (dihydrolipoyllysine-residue acetyltransferase)
VAYEFKLPDLGEGLTEGEIARWLVSEGQEIAEDDPLVEIQTDKTTVEIPSPAAGTVTSILVEEGKVVPVGTVLVVIGGDSGDGAPRVEAERAAVSQSVPAAKGRATPLVRKIAQELGVDLDSLTGTGPQGRVTEEDVRGAGAPGEGRREPLRGVRRVIAEHMARAHREVPAVTWVEECDFSGLDLDVLVPTVLKAVAESLQEFPELNARLEGDEIVFLDRYDLGVAVQTDAGLLVPVVRDCDSRSVDELGAEVRRLAESARAGRLAPEELRGSTFTVTSAGKLGGLLQTPIVNHPEVAILSIGRIGERPVVRDGAVVAARVGYVSVTFDHRVVDGARAAEFGLDVIRRLEQRGGGRSARSGAPLDSVVRVVLVQLCSDLSARPGGRVDVRVRLAGGDRTHELVVLARIDSLRSRPGGCCDRRRHVSRRDRAVNRPGLRAGLRAGRPVAEVCAEEHGDAAVHASLAEVNVRLLDGALEPAVAELPVDRVAVLAHVGRERRRGAARDRRHFLVAAHRCREMVEPGPRAACQRVRGDSECRDADRERRDDSPSSHPLRLPVCPVHEEPGHRGSGARASSGDLRS